jgi:DNA invertase Pin-like site-specific DNA recombinase
MKVGYARISTPTQNLQMQIDALEKEGCRPIFQEIVSGAKADRPQWKQCIEMLREGDTLVVWAIDRMGRNLTEQVNIVNDLVKKKVKIYSISQRLDSESPEGMFTINLLCVMAENERQRTIVRILDGIKCARARGKFGGRRYKHSEKTRELIRAMYESKKYSLSEISDMHKISVATIYNYINKK